MMTAVRPMVTKRGESNRLSKLTPSDIPVIRTRYRAGEYCHGIAPDYGVTPSTIHKVIVGASWRHVPDPLGPIILHGDPGSLFPSGKGGIAPSERGRVITLVGLGMNDREVARTVGVTPGYVRRLRTGGQKSPRRKVVRGFDRLETALRTLTDLVEVDVYFQGRTTYTENGLVDPVCVAVQNARQLLDDIENLKRMP